MADIADELNAISTSIYGHEMRGAIHDALETVNNDNENIHDELAQLAQIENIFAVNDEEQDADESLTAKKCIFTNGIFTRYTDVNYKCKIYHGLNIADNTWVFDTYCADVSVPVAILCVNAGGELLRQCVPIYAEKVGAINKTIPITKEGTGYPSDTCTIVINSYQNTPTLYKHEIELLNVYTKDETDALLRNKANTSDVYTKTESDTLLSAKANSTDVYTKTESDTLLNAKANTSDVYTKTQADTLLVGKVDVSDFEDLEADVESIMLYVGYKEVAGLCADFENNTFTRIAGSVGKSAGTDFDSWNLFGGRRRCNVADDGTINAWYGDNDFVEDGSNGQVMVYQPKFYYRVEPLKLEAQSTGIGYHLKKANYYVSDTQKAGFKLHPAFIDKNGNEIDYILFSAYEGCLYDTSASAYITNDSQVMNTSEDKLSSIANVKPCSGTTQNLTRPNVETLAQNRGTNWHGETIQFVSVNQLLCAIEYASFNFQTAIGQGVVSYESGTGNEASNTGATSTLGNASGQATETTHVSSDNVTTIDTTAGKLSVSYRGVENIWGNIWKFEYGVNIWGDGTMNGGQPYICSDYNFAESKNSDNYVGAGFTVANEYGYVKYFGYSEDFDYLFIASRVGGTSSLPVGDYFYAESNLNAYRIARLGGCWFYGSRAGSFYWYLYDGVGIRDRSIGCRLAYTPTR